MADTERTELEQYNLSGGQRRVLIVNGAVKAVAPGLRIVAPTPAEREPYDKKREEEQEPMEYGLPV